MKTEVTTKIMTITPDMAQRWLDNMPVNRRVKGPKVAQYAAAMAADAWHLNGESLSFDAHGKALNGQHRFLACVKAGVSFRSVVVIGIDPAGVSTIDTGTGRSLADQQAVCPIGPNSAPRPTKSVNSVNGALRVAACHFGGRGWNITDYDANVTAAGFELADTLVRLLAGKAYPNLRLRSGAGVIGAMVRFGCAHGSSAVLQTAQCLKYGPEVKGIPLPCKRAAEKIRTFLAAMDHAEKEQVAFEIVTATLETCLNQKQTPPSHRTVERMRAWALEVLQS
jgi:hypothetical protein